MSTSTIPPSVQARRQPTRLSLLARGVLYRRGIAVMTLVMAALAVAAAAAGPAYRDSAAVSSLRNRMTAAPPAASGVEFSGTSWPGDSPDVVLGHYAVRLPNASAMVAQLLNGRRTQSSSTQAVVPVPRGTTVTRSSIFDQRYDPQYAALTWRQDECSHLHFVTGRCPSSPQDVALALPAATLMGAVVGSPLTVTGLDAPEFGPDRTLLGATVPPVPRPQQKAALHEHVVGIFTVPDPAAPYWFGQNIGQNPLDATGAQVNTVTVLASRSGLTSLPPPYRAQVTIDEPLDWSHVGTGEAAALGQRITTFHHPAAIAVASSVPALLRADAADRSDLGRLVVFADIQLIVLIGLATIIIVATSIARRRSELVAAALRGRRPLRTSLELAAEPGALLAIGIVPGLLLTPALVSLASSIWLRPDTPVGLSATSVVAGVVTVAVVLVTSVALGFGAASPPAESGWRWSPSPWRWSASSSWSSAVAATTRRPGRCSPRRCPHWRSA